MRLISIIVLILSLTFIGFGCWGDSEDFDASNMVTSYGNWCGPGNSGSPDSTIVDEMDGCCKKHDECYDTNSIEPDEYAECRDGVKVDCDDALVDCINGLSEQTGDAKRYETYMKNIFATCSLLSNITK